ncbi:hypothetical protein NDN08_003535 [Rhodosorus marinus]|uniref:Thioredoxin domain-containing protein n=1 Tax=Rhodosorus marinus TaxID=101924 RepID=A0AAV8V0H2_9RHOD|nr:hypothetical protein NDN08_003535 [Rhodosorus marinus]
MAFIASSFMGTPLGRAGAVCTAQTQNVVRMLVSDIGSKAELDKVLEGAGSSLVVVDYSTSWCGPCKMIEPKFQQMSEEYSDVVFLKVMGDKDEETQEMMKTESIRAVPAFHFWKEKERVHTITGARTDDIESAIDTYK